MVPAITLTLAFPGFTISFQPPSRIEMKGVQGVMTRWTEPWPWSGASRYGLALLATGLVLVLRGVLDPVIGGYIPYLAVLPAVLFAARCCGWGPSLLVTLLAFLGEQYWFIPPVHSLRIVGAAERTGTLVYFFVCFHRSAGRSPLPRSMAPWPIRPVPYCREWRSRQLKRRRDWPVRS